MRRKNYSSFSKYALIACFAMALLLGQTFKLHMHIGHEDISSSATTSHIVDVHADTSIMHSSSHNSMHDNHHEDDLGEDHHADEIDLSSSSLVKKNLSFNQFVFFFFIISIVLSLPQLSHFLRKQDFTLQQAISYYLLQPPLRAPPVHPAQQSV